MFQMSKTPNPPSALKKIIDIISTKGFEIRYFSSHDTILKTADSRDMFNSGYCHLLKKKKSGPECDPVPSHHTAALCWTAFLPSLR